MAWVKFGGKLGEPYMINTNLITRYFAWDFDADSTKKLGTKVYLQEGDKVSEITCGGYTPSDLRAAIEEAEKSEAQKLRESLEDKGF